VKKFKIAVMGMGYVGLTSGVSLAKHGFQSICTTTTPFKVHQLNSGVPPFYEPGLSELVKGLVEKGLLSGSIDNVNSVKQSDLTFICVGTPSLSDGSADLSAISDVSREIGTALKDMDCYHLVVVKSTVHQEPLKTLSWLILPNILERGWAKTLDYV